MVADISAMNAAEASPVSPVKEHKLQGLHGCYVKTPFGWGICTADDPSSEHLKVDLDWQLRNARRASASVLRTSITDRSLCAAGHCVLTPYGTGVVLGFRAEDAVYTVQLWGAPGRGRRLAYLQPAALLKVLPAAAGLLVETPFGNGVCRSYRPADEAGGLPEAFIVDLPWGQAVLASDCIKCPVALVVPLIDRFLQHAADIVRAHSGTLSRVKDALHGLGLEKLQQRLATSAGEAAEMASKLWEEFEAQDAADLVAKGKEFADPKMSAMLKAGITRLNKMLIQAEGFNGVWVGKDDDQPRCTITDAVVKWHWGDESELEIWGANDVSTQVPGEEICNGTVNEAREITWSDGDVWVRRVGSAGGAEAGSADAAMDELQEEATAAAETLRQRVRQGLGDLRRIVNGDGEFADDEKSLEAALGALTTAAAGDGEVQKIVDQVKERREALAELQGQVMESKTGKILKEARSRFSTHLQHLKDTEIAPHLQRIQGRSKRFVTRLTTDRTVKNKASELFSLAQGRFQERWNDPNSLQRDKLEAWVATVKEKVMGRLSVHRAMLVDGLASSSFMKLTQTDFKQLLAGHSWDPAALEAKLEDVLVRTHRMSGIKCSGTELLDQFERSSSVSEINILQRTSRGLLTSLGDLHIEIPTPLLHLLEAQAAGRSQDVKAWQDAIVGSLDDDNVVKGASQLLERGEAVLARFDGLKDNKTVARVMEHLENQDLERELIQRFQDINPERMVSTAEGALTNARDREELVSQMKDACLDFILKVLPAIKIDKLEGHDNGCDWEINNISFSNFHFRKENVHIRLGDPGKDEDLVKVSADQISAHFKDLQVRVKQDHFPFIDAKGAADAMARGMSVSISFRLQAETPAVSRKPPPPVDRRGAAPSTASTGSAGSSPAASSVSAAASNGALDKGAPKMVVSSRAVFMETLDLTVRKSNYSMIVNALAYLFSDVLREYASQKIAKHLDNHTGALIDSLNNLLDASAPMLAKFGWQLPTATPAIDELPDVTQAEEGPMPLDLADDFAMIDWADPGRAFAVRV
eukprot:TRINITY_DN90290_c0_g1_i1.p1 TRINITY_DN90290_c0_g1~~TRINITY_DN90290_c0_g1_i1.p1  ORF type:complete len:1042 (+),score=266.94 TRINITY_DN90290_c0_g1_i1:124-3249(+)